jgi:hypothetical protein
MIAAQAAAQIAIVAAIRMEAEEDERNAVAERINGAQRTEHRAKGTPSEERRHRK